MAIDRYIADSKTLPLISVEDETRKLNEVLPENLKANFNVSAYLEFLPVLKAAAKIEEAGVPTDLQEKNARINAAKLILIFKNSANALDYLRRFEKHHVADVPRPVHTGCLFYLCAGTWNIPLWQGLVAANPPSHTNDLIFRILPFAESIDNHIKNNRESIIRAYEEKIRREYTEKYTREFEERAKQTSEEVFIRTELERAKIAIEEEQNRKIDFYFRKILNLSGKKLSPEEINHLGERKRHPKPEDEEEVKSIRKNVLDEFSKKIKKNYSKLTVEVPSTKEEYLANKLEQANDEIKSIARTRYENLLTQNAPLTVLSDFAKLFCYKSAHKNQRAANLFFEYGMPEEAFDLFLKLTPKDNNAYIPDVLIRGDEITPKYKGFYLTKLKPDDPRAAILGRLTSCCQSLGHAGEDCAIHGITDERGGFYVICKMKGANISEDDEIISQTWAWNADVIGLDSIETHLNYRKFATMISDFYATLGFTLVKKYQIPQVVVGAAGETPQGLGCFGPKTEYEPLNYKGYRDSLTQRFIASKDIPLVEMHLALNPDSAFSPILQSDSILKQEKPNTRAFDFNGLNGMGEVSWHALLLNVNPPQWELAKWFLTHGAHLSATNAKYRTLIDICVERDRLDIIQWLLKNFPKIYILQLINDRRLHRAAYQGNWQMVNWLILNGADVNSVDQNFHNDSANLLLNIAIIKSASLDQIRFLLEHGARLDIPMALGGYPAHVAIKCGRTDVVNLLINDYGVDINKNDKEGDPLIFGTLRKKNWEFARALINYGADLTLTNLLKWTVLTTAIRYGAPIDFIKLLIAKGCDVAKEISPDRGPITEAVLNHEEAFYLLVEEYKKQQIKFNQRELDIALQYAITNNHNNLFAPLIENGAQITQPILCIQLFNEFRKNTHNTLEVAAAHGNIEFLKFAQSKGISLDYTTADKLTLVHTAAAHGKFEAVKWLEQQGLDLKAQDKHGRTPYDLASKPPFRIEKNPALVEYLSQLPPQVSKKF